MRDISFLCAKRIRHHLVYSFISFYWLNSFLRRAISRWAEFDCVFIHAVKLTLRMCECVAVKCERFFGNYICLQIGISAPVGTICLPMGIWLCSFVSSFGNYNFADLCVVLKQLRASLVPSRETEKKTLYFRRILIH